jgi:RNA polymerase sigma factor for flagellar operon FliA
MIADRERLEALFLANLHWIERTVAAVCRRHGFNTDDVPDVTSWVKLRLVEDDYAVFRKFRGESAVTTYLTVVVAMLVREYRVQCWGRWRPSAAARRQGDVAVRLETLVYRDGYGLSQAAQLLHTAGETSLSDRELATLLAQLPTRTLPRPVEAGPELLAETPTTARADDLLVGGELLEHREATGRALTAALAYLPPEEQVILRMRYWEGMSLADVARALVIPQKPLYRRVERALGALRKYLEAGGMSREDVRELLTDWAP